MPWAIAVALWWLLPAGVAPVGLVGVPFACEVGRCACGSGACWALCRQTAGCNAGTAGADGYRAWCNRPAEYWKHCKRPARHFRGLKPVKRQPWTPIRSHCCGRDAGTAGADGYRAWCNRPAEYWKHCKRPAKHFRGLKPVKRQPWTPIRSHCCGRGDALSHCCGLGLGATGRPSIGSIANGRRGILGVWSLKPVKRQPWTPIRSHCCGRGDALALWWLLPAGVAPVALVGVYRLPAKLGVVRAGVARVGLCAGKRQAATLEQHRLTASIGSIANGRRGILGVWSLSNGSLERL